MGRHERYAVRAAILVRKAATVLDPSGLATALRRVDPGFSTCANGKHQHTGLVDSVCDSYQHGRRSRVGGHYSGPEGEEWQCTGEGAADGYGE